MGGSRRRTSTAGRACAAAALAFALCGAGCAGLDRESYSLIYRNPAHQYEPLSPWQQEELERYEATRVSKSGGFVASVAYQPFRPFRYCHRHDSYHVGESVGAFAMAPVEFPVSVGVYMGTIGALGVASFGQRVARNVAWAWNEIFGSPDPPRIPDDPDRDERSKQ